MYYPYIDRYEFYENLPIYLLITILLVLISIFVYIKLSFPFWNIQPVYHSYDFWRTLYSYPFIIHKRFLVKNTNKYHDLRQVEIVPFVDATDKQKKDFINLLQCFLLPSENSVFVLNNENLETYFGGHMFSSYISFYNQDYYTEKNKNNDIIKPDTPIGCISSRSGELFIKGYNNNNAIPIYYIDFLCIHREANYKKISRTLLQTHIYKQQLLDDINSKTHVGSQTIMVSLFRREKELLFGIVPLTRFQTVYYEIPNTNNQKLITLPEHIILIHINHSNIYMFVDFLESCKLRFECFLRTDIPNIIEMIKQGILYVYCLKRIDDILSVYLFRDTRMSYDELGSVLQLVGSIHNSSSQNLFIDGYINSIFEITKKMQVYKVLMVDEISDNGILMRTRYPIINSHWTAYYLYNMIVPYSPLRKINSFILF